MKTMLLALFFLGSTFHDIQVAYYKIHQEEDGLNIEFVLEEKDLLSALKSADIKFTEENLREYIDTNFSLTLNSKQQVITFDSIIYEHKHIFLVGVLPQEAPTISSIHIKNTCLLHIENQSNIVEVKLHEKQRDFLMNKERTLIEITY